MNGTTERAMTQGTGRRGRGSWTAVLAAVLALFAAAVPAEASLRSWFGDAQVNAQFTYTCGSPAVGMIGLFNSSTPVCATQSWLTVPATGNLTIATFAGSAALSGTRITPIRGKQLSINANTTVAGTLTFELGHSSMASVTFTSLGSVTVPMSVGSGWVNVDMGSVKGSVPLGNRLALRLSKVSSTYQGSLQFSASSSFAKSPTVSVYEGAWFVNPAGGADATDIKTMVNDARLLAGDTIFLNDGTYKGSNNKGISFSKNLTITSLNGADKVLIDLEYSGTAFLYSGSTQNNTMVLDGVTIARAGTGAVSISNAAYPKITNSVFRDNENSGGYGGAISVGSGVPAGDPTIDGCIFSNNRSQYGGAISLTHAAAGNPRLVISKSTFVRNSASDDGGAVFILATTATSSIGVFDSTFVGNAAKNGGAIRASYDGYVAVWRCQFTDNFAWNGGALYSKRMDVGSSVFIGNTASAAGGAILADGGTASLYTTVNHCTVTGNFVGTNYYSQDGAGMAVTSGYAKAINSIFWGNRRMAGDPFGRSAYEIDLSGSGNLYYGWCDLEGGLAAVNADAGQLLQQGPLMDVDPQFAFDSVPELRRTSPCVDAGTDTGFQGGSKNGVSRLLAAAPDLGAYEFVPVSDTGDAYLAVDRERIVFTARANGAPPNAETVQVRNLHPDRPLDWSVVESLGWLSVREPGRGDTTEEIDSFTLLPDISGLAAGEYRGTVYVYSSDVPATSTTTDGYHGAPRAIHVVLRVTRQWSVCPSGCDFTTIDDAVKAAAEGDEVVVGDGSYPGNFRLRNKAITLRSRNGAEFTTIDCGGASTTGISVPSGDFGSIFEGLTIQNCNPAGNGGGISSGVLTSFSAVDCVFRSNKPTGASYGGGVYVGGEAFVANSRFEGNDAYGGGGLYLAYNTDSQVEIRNCTFTKNTATLGGGIGLAGPGDIYNSTFDHNNNPSLTRASATGGGLNLAMTWAGIIDGCLFDSNGDSNGTTYAGGVYVDTQRGVIANSIFRNNKADYGGGINASNYVEIVNSTFYKNTADSDGGGAVLYAGLPRITNSLFSANTAATLLQGYDTSPNNYANASYCFISNGWNAAGDNNIYGSNLDPKFVDTGATPPDLRLTAASPCIDKGKTVNWLFSDYRGSVRAVDGNSDGASKFDIGAYEYSRYYGGIGEDAPAPAFRDLKINGSLIATGNEYRIEWSDKDPFPNAVDERVRQAGAYDARLLLVDEHGRRVELGTWTKRIGQSYAVPVTFGAEHLGTWRLRLEMVADPNQRVESDPITIQHKDLVKYDLGKEITPPPGAVAGLQPDVDYAPAVYWSTETGKLWAVGPFTTVITWYADRERTIPLQVLASLQTPADPQFHVADTPPVDLLPAGSPFSAVQVMWSDSGAVVSGNRFTATMDGWAVLLFKDQLNPDPSKRELFTVTRTLTWDHEGVTDVNGAPYNKTLGAAPPVDPIYPVEQASWPIGTEATDGEHQGALCGGGYTVQEMTPVDSVGANRAYDRGTRTGPIIPVNEDNQADTADDLVVVWYRQHAGTRVCWPFKPVRYDPTWPTPSVTCSNDTGHEAQSCNQIDITLAWGTGALQPELFGPAADITVYDQPDRALPGFNPNEEHAMLFPAQGSPYPAAFPLRSDLNRGTDTTAANFTSKAWVLVKYKDPAQGNAWRMRAFNVVPGTLTYAPYAGQEFNPPYPLSQFVFGPCRDTAAGGHNGSWSDSGLPDVLVDKDNRLLAVRGDVTVTNRYYYRRQDGFWFDENNDGVADKPAGTCIPWLAGKDGGNPYSGDPAPVTNNVVWPDPVPTLYVGETLLDAKQQPGESVGLPNVKDQCIVKVLWDEANVSLMDPTREHSSTDETPPKKTPKPPVTVPSLPAGLRTDPPTGIGTSVRFVDLPPTLQDRLTYDSVAQVLRLKGQYTADTGEPTLLLPTLSKRERMAVQNLTTPAIPDSAPFMKAIDKLIYDGDAMVTVNNTEGLRDADVKAISAANVLGTGYVVLLFNNDTSPLNERICTSPTVVSIIKVGCPLYTGAIKVVESSNAFDEKITLRHNADFGGQSQDRYFEWKYLMGFNGTPVGPMRVNQQTGLLEPNPDETWLAFDASQNSSPGQATGYTGSISQGGGSLAWQGMNDITPKGTGLQLLPDRWFTVRYVWQNPPAGGLCGGTSPWTPPQLAEGWVKRVMKKVNLFDQKVKDFHKTDADTVAHMISQAGRAYEGDVALSDNPAYLKSVGLIELYETLLKRALKLTYDAGDATGPVKDAVLLAATRLAALYTLLGNEAYADSADPTVGFGTQDGQYGSAAGSMFAFQNQVDSLIQEELALLRGRDGAGVRPYYNRLPWNFTIGEGEVAYRQTYGITDVADATSALVPDGEINEYDAKALFPQGHGDAWGHYLSALKKYYLLITHDQVNNQLWTPNTEAILVAQSAVSVDYRDERAFAAAAAARARAGADIVGLAYRSAYDELPANQWQGYPDTVATRYWGLADWGSRAGQAAYVDWAVGNALLPYQDSEPTHRGNIKKVDRTTVTELFEIPAQFDAIQATLDQADQGLNPLGVAKDTVPFDIDPALVAAGRTHFEQIHDRAGAALQNAATLFDYANQSSQMLRRQQDSLDDFKRTIADREADFTSRLIEVFGYPYPEDCGAGKLYPTGYCTTGPDLYHYMYVEPSQLMGTASVREHTFTLNLRDLAVDDAGGLVEKTVPVTYTVDTDARFGIIKPAAWLGSRRAPGALQLARQDLLLLRGRFERALIDYDQLVAQIEDQARLLQAQHDLSAAEIRVLQEGKSAQQTLNDTILSSRESELSLRSQAQDALLVANAAMEAIPKILGVGMSVVTDPFAPLRAIALGAANVASVLMNQQADAAGLAELGTQQAKEIAAAESNLRLVALRADYAAEQQLLQLEALVRREASQRQELYTLLEGMTQSASRYLNGLAAGERVLEERLRFRKQTAAQVQDYRYTDMTFRVFRNDALQKYKAQLDLASRYVYLAAKAYDYDTALLSSSSLAGRAFLSGIVKERTIGTVLGGQPLAGSGLADTMRRLSTNFQVLKPQLGFNNPQLETNRFSLRSELLRVRFGSGSDGTWRGALEGYKVADLWQVPEFRRHCRPFAAEGIAQPGLVIPFRTTVTSGLNFFGWPLGGGDSYYSAANFATKIRSVGVWFSNYNATGLAQTPRVYLVPAGEDVLRTPTGGVGDIRSWHVLDQRIPAPQLVNTREMAADRGWIPAASTILDELGAVRRQADFKAFHDSGALDPSEMTYDTRLIGRSVWNTKWMLIIPGRNLLHDPDEGIETFVNGPEAWGGAGERTGNGVSDVKLFFETYSYTGY